MRILHTVLPTKNGSEMNTFPFFSYQFNEEFLKLDVSRVISKYRLSFNETGCFWMWRKFECTWGVT